jgi:hypothetical protein
MTHDELLEILDSCIKGSEYGPYEWGFIALRAVVELHKPDGQSKPFPDWANCCGEAYPCPTIQAIEKELG